MTGDLSDDLGGPSISPQLESSPSGSYIEFEFSRQSSEAYEQPLISDGYTSDEFMNIYFYREKGDTHNIDDLATKLEGLKAQADAENSQKWTKRFSGDNAPTTALKLSTNEFKGRRLLSVSDDSLRVDVEDFYTSLTIGLDSLKGLADPFFLTADFMQQSITLLQILDSDVRALLEKLTDLRRSSSAEFCRALLDYKCMSEKILKACKALTFSATLLNGYHSSQAEASVVAVEALVALPKSAPRVVHMAKAEEAVRCIERAQTETVRMQGEVKKLFVSSNRGSLSDLVPNLNVINPMADFAKWSGMWGVLFAMRTASFYITQLLLAGLAHGGEGPAIVLESTHHMALSKSGWAIALVGLHIEARKNCNKMKDSRRCLDCTFMSRDNDLLQLMLQDTKGHLQSLLDQGKFLNMGVYLGSWQTHKKKLTHNVPRLRQHLMLVRHRLSSLVEAIVSLAGRMSQNLSDGQLHLD